MIFWGGIICIFDFNFRLGFGGKSINFNILNDLIGVVLILFGIIILLNLDISKVFSYEIIVVAIFALSWFAAVFFSTLNEGFHSFISPLWVYFRYLGPIGILVFCFSMLELSRRYCSELEVNSWKRTTFFFLFFAILPTFCLWTIGLFFPNQGEEVWTYLGYGLIAGYLLAHWQFFISISKMVRRSKSKELLAPEIGAI
jgi:hypothetical protein